MSMESKDQASGFRHHEVIQFINNEVHSNGGGRDIYTTFLSRSWNEVEDCLQTVVTDPQLPRTVKRACAWSALALNVRFAAQQQEQQAQQAQQVQLLQAQIEEREAASWALASELQQVRRDCEAMVAQLHFTGLTLQQVLWERDALHARLLYYERMTQGASLIPDTPVSQADQPGMTPCPPNTEQLGENARDMRSRLCFENPRPTMLYVPGPLGLWAPPMQAPTLVPAPSPVLCPAVFSTEVPFLAPPLDVVMGTQPTFAPLQMPTPLGVYPAVGSQNNTASQWSQDNYDPEEGSNTHQSTESVEDSKICVQQNPEQSQGVVFEENCCHSQANGAENPQQVSPSGDEAWRNQERLQGLATVENCCHYHQEGDSEKTQKVDTLDKESSETPQAVAPEGFVKTDSHVEDAEASQRIILPGDSGTQSQEKHIEEPQKLPPLEDNRIQQQDDNLELPNGVNSLGAHKKLIQEQNPDKKQETGPLNDSRSNPEGISQLVQSGNPCQSPKEISLRDNHSKSPQAVISRNNKSQGRKQSRKKQQAQGQRAKQVKESQSLSTKAGEILSPSLKEF